MASLMAVSKWAMVMMGIKVISCNNGCSDAASEARPQSYVCRRCAGTAGCRVEIGIKMTEIVLEMSLVFRLQQMPRTTTHG